jgi:hypothetical protein
MNRTHLTWYEHEPETCLDETRHLELEERAVYREVFDLLMIYGPPLEPPGDPDRWFAHRLHISVRAWRPLLAALLDKTKMKPTAKGGITHPRAEELWAARAEISRKNADNRREGWRVARESRANRHEIADENSEKPNNFNGGTATTVERPLNQLHRQPQDKEKCCSPSIPQASGEPVEEQGTNGIECRGGLEHVLRPLLDFAPNDKRWEKRVFEWGRAHAARVGVVTLGRAVKRGVEAIDAKKMEGPCYFAYLDGFVRNIHEGSKPRRSRRGATRAGDLLPAITLPPVKASEALRKQLRERPAP